MISRGLLWVGVDEGCCCGGDLLGSGPRYTRHNLSLEEARILVETDRDGATLAGLRDGGRAIGLNARRAHAIYEALEHISLPSIVHMQGGEGHYLVLCRWIPDGVIVLDPNRGVRRLSRAQFEADWSGYLIEYGPTPMLERRATNFDPLACFLRLAQQHMGGLALALF